MRKILMCAALTLGLCFVLPMQKASAGEDVKILDSTIDKYQNMAKTWEPAIKKAATRLFFVLCVISLVYTVGFGGGRWTSSIAVNYFKTVFALAMQIFTFCLLIGVGQSEITKLTTGMRTTKSISVANYWSLGGLIDNPVKVVHSETLTLSDMCVVLVFAVVLAMLVSRLPGLVAGIITGSSISAMAFGGVGGAMGAASGLVGAAAGAAAGAGMVAAQASGAGMAISSAYQQTQQNMADGAGKFAGAALSGGLSGVMSKGLNFASDMMANMVSGAGNAAKESLQKNTMGGAVAAHIDSSNAAGMAMRQAAAANNDAGGNADTGASEGDAADSSSNDSDSGAMSDSGGISSGTAYDRSKIGLPDGA